jgi:hypothetical protein
MNQDSVGAIVFGKGSGLLSFFHINIMICRYILTWKSFETGSSRKPGSKKYNEISKKSGLILYQ